MSETVKCPNCGNEVAIPRNWRYVGTVLEKPSSIDCPFCGIKFNIPTPTPEPTEPTEPTTE